MPPLTACFAWLLAVADGARVPAALQGLWQLSSWQPPCSTLMACMHPLATRGRLTLPARAACHWGCPLTWWGTILPTCLHLPSSSLSAAAAGACNHLDCQPCNHAAFSAVFDNLQQHTLRSHVMLQVRGQLNGFSQMCLTGEAFRQCTACSPAVVDRYRQHGWDFVLEALQVSIRLQSCTTLLGHQTQDVLDQLDLCGISMLPSCRLGLLQQGTGCWCCRICATHSSAAATCGISGWPDAVAPRVLEDLQGLHASAAVCLVWLAAIDLLGSCHRIPRR